MEGKNILLWMKNWIFLLVAVGLGVLIMFLPLLTSQGVWVYATYTTAQWIAWGITKGISSILCYLIFMNMAAQGRKNASATENYKRAQQLLAKCKDKEYKPESPLKHSFKLYGTKGATMLLTTALMLIAFTEAVIVLSWAELLSYMVTWGTSMLFGFMTMTNEEDWWTNNYLEYAEWEYDRHLKEQNGGNNNGA